MSHPPKRVVAGPSLSSVLRKEWWRSQLFVDRSAKEVKPFDLVFVLDEFQRIAEYDSDLVERRLRIDRDNGSFLFLDRFFGLWVERLPR